MSNGNLREEVFEQKNPPPPNVWWSDERNRYVGVSDNRTDTLCYQSKWEGFEQGWVFGIEN